MTKEAFLQIVQGAQFLDEERRKELIKNANWMSPEERQGAADLIQSTGATLADLEQQEAQQIDALYEAVQKFKHEEVPKMMKEKEASEESAEAKEAQELLGDWEEKNQNKN